MSLKHFLQLIDEKRIIDKCPSNNNHLANFKDKNNRLVPRTALEYAAGDTAFLARRLATFESETGIPLSCLATPLSHPNEGDDVSFVKVVEELALSDRDPNREVTGFSRRELDLLETICSARPFAKVQMEKAQKSIKRQRAFKSFFKRKTKMIRQPNTRDIKIRYIPPSEDRVFTAPPVALHEQSVFTDFYHSDDEYGLPKRSKNDEGDDNRRNARRCAELSSGDSDEDGEFLQSTRVFVTTSAAESPLPPSLLVPHEGSGSKGPSLLVPPEGSGSKCSSLSVPHEGSGSKCSSLLVPHEGSGSKYPSLLVPREGSGSKCSSLLVPPEGSGSTNSSSSLHEDANSLSPLHYRIKRNQTEPKLQKLTFK